MLPRRFSLPGDVQVALELLGEAFELLVHLLYGLGVQPLLQARDLLDAGRAQDLGPDHLPDEVGVHPRGLGELLDGLHPLLHLPGQLDLLLQGEEGHLADLVQVLAHGVGSGHLGKGQLLLFLKEPLSLPRKKLVRFQVQGVFQGQVPSASKSSGSGSGRSARSASPSLKPLGLRPRGPPLTGKR